MNKPTSMELSFFRAVLTWARIALSTAAVCVLFASLKPHTSVAQDPVVEKGREIYNGIGACASCHGPEGKGDGPAASTLSPKPRNFGAKDFIFDTNGDGKKGTETDLIDTIVYGTQKYKGSPYMVGRPDFSEEDRKAMAKFILSLGK